MRVCQVKPNYLNANEIAVAYDRVTRVNRKNFQGQKENVSQQASGAAVAVDGEKKACDYAALCHVISRILQRLGAENYTTHSKAAGDWNAISQSQRSGIQGLPVSIKTTRTNPKQPTCTVTKKLICNSG